MIGCRLGRHQGKPSWDRSAKMRNRWGVLAVLFLIRSTMAVQFQSVAAVAPLLGADLGISLADIGILVGLYSVPGVALALPGGAVGQRIRDKKNIRRGHLFIPVTQFYAPPSSA